MGPLSLNLYFFLPLLITGLVHHLVIIRYNLFSQLAKPIDGNLKFHNQPLIGKSKTWRGIIVVVGGNIVLSILVYYLLRPELAVSPIWIGLSLGIGYALAEIPTSFIKRRFGIMPSGQVTGRFHIVFYILDQIDSVTGAVIMLSMVLHNFSIFQALYLWLIGVSLHVAIDTILYFKGYKKSIGKPEIFKIIYAQKQQR